MRSRDRSRLPLGPRVARHLLRLILSALFRIGLEGEPPRTGSYILIANHQGWTDALLFIALFPPEPRIHFFGDQQAVTMSWWRRLLIAWHGGVVRVDRAVSVDRSAIEVALRYLRDGAVLVVFPEGRVSRAEGQLAEFQRGVAFLAMKARVPVLPVWLRGTGELYLRRELVATVGRRGMPPDEQPSKAATVAYARALHAEVAALSRPWVEPVGVRKRWHWLTNIL